MKIYCSILALLVWAFLFRFGAHTPAWFLFLLIWLAMWLSVKAWDLWRR